MDFQNKYLTHVGETSSNNLFYSLQDENLFTLEFHLLDQIAEDVFLFGDLTYVDASPLEHFNYIIKNV